MELSKQTCKPCEGGILPMDNVSIEKQMKYAHSDWQMVVDAKAIERIFEFVDFSEAMGFVNTVAAIAEEQGHHPDIRIFDYKKVAVTLTTHAINGLSINDFIVAAKIDVIKK